MEDSAETSTNVPGDNELNILELQSRDASVAAVDLAVDGQAEATDVCEGTLVYASNEFEETYVTDSVAAGELGAGFISTETTAEENSVEETSDKTGNILPDSVVVDDDDVISPVTDGAAVERYITYLGYFSAVNDKCLKMMLRLLVACRLLLVIL